MNDVAVAVATLRAEGYTGRVAVLDLDAHPPDGIAACLARDPGVWIGSISGSDWGRLEGVDETVLPEGTGDAAYLDALGAARSAGCHARASPSSSPAATSSPAIASGASASRSRAPRARDLLVAAELEGVPTVWLPAGRLQPELPGASSPAPGWRWRRARATRSRRRTTRIAARFEQLADELSPTALTEAEQLTAEEIEEELGIRPRRQRVLLGFYTAEGIEHALYRFGIFDHLERLGYRQFRAAFDAPGAGERVRIFGQSGGMEHLLVEVVVEKRRVAGVDALYIHWLSLRNPRAVFSDLRPRLPGQDVPGLGISRASSGPCSPSWRRASASARWCFDRPTSTPRTRHATRSSSSIRTGRAGSRRSCATSRACRSSRRRSPSPRAGCG